MAKSETNQTNSAIDATETRMMTGADIVIQTLINNGVSVVFAYPGGVNIPLHQTLTHFRDQIRVILPRHEQGGGFAAQGYARSTGKIGVCMATSGPGATNLVTSIADAKLDSVPILAITGQVSVSSIGTDAFQEIPTTEVCRSITKHHYLVTRTEDLVRVINEAIFVATTGRPGPVLIDIAKNALVSQCYPDFNVPMNLPGYPGKMIVPANSELDVVAEALARARRPVIFVGGGVVNAEATEALNKIVDKTNAPVTTSMTGLSAFPRSHRCSLGMLGMHGNPCANFAVNECDLLLALGVRFSDRVTGKLSEFAKNARVIQIDVDPSELNKIKKTNLAIAADLKETLPALAERIQLTHPQDLTLWHQKIEQWKQERPMIIPEDDKYIMAQYAISELSNALQGKDFYISTGVGQHQLWTAQFFHFERQRTWLSSCGLGTMGFGLPGAMGAKVAHPESLVIDIDGDGSFLMNIQEMATCSAEKIPVKVMLLNNQHLGNVMQWEDQFYNKNRANTYLGSIDDPEAVGKGTERFPAKPYPNYEEIAKGFGWETVRIINKADLSRGIQQMLTSEKPFLLDVVIPYRQYVLPITPAGGTLNEMICAQRN